MIKNGLKNFYKNLMYVFIPMGIVYLFFILAIFIFFSAFVSDFTKTANNIIALVGTSLEQSSSSIDEMFSYMISQLRWQGSLFGTIKHMIQSGWIKQTIVSFFETLNISSAGFEEQLTILINNFVSGIKAKLAVAITIGGIGLFLANFVTRYAVRRKTAKRGVKKFVIAHTLVPILENIMMLGFLILLAFIKQYSLIAMFFMVIFNAVFSLISSWLIHRDGNLKLKSVLTEKNILKHMATLGIILLINIVLAVVLTLINLYFAILVMIPVVIYSINIADVNTDSYVLSLINTPNEITATPDENTATPDNK